MTTTLAESGISAGNSGKIKRLQGLLVGAPGSRKTVTAHSMPGTRTIDFDDGMQSVEWAILAGVLKKELNEIVYETILPESPGEEGMAEMLNRATDQVDAWIEEEDIPPEEWDKPYPQFWDTLIIDSASFMMDAAIGMALTENQRVDLSKSLAVGKAGLKKSQRDHGLYIVPMRKQDWGSAGNLFLKAVRQWKTLGKNLIITAHEYYNTDESGNLLNIQPNVVGQLRTKLPAALDEVWYTKTKATSKSIEVVFRVQPDAKREAKTRLGCLGPEEAADFAAIKKKVAKFYNISEDALWTPYHGTKGRLRAEREADEEAQKEIEAI